jgi:hypothetical protein
LISHRLNSRPIHSAGNFDYNFTLGAGNYTENDIQEAARAFISEHAYFKRIKSPVELVLGAAKSAWPGPPAPTVVSDLVLPVGWTGGSGPR